MNICKSIVIVIAVVMILSGSALSSAVADAGLIVKVVPVDEAYLAGQPMVLRLTFQNTSQQTLTFQLPYAVSEAFAFSSVPNFPRKIQIHNLYQYGSRIPTHPVTLGVDEKYERYLVLNEWFVFHELGGRPVTWDAKIDGALFQGNFDVTLNPFDATAAPQRVEAVLSIISSTINVNAQIDLMDALRHWRNIDIDRVLEAIEVQRKYTTIIPELRKRLKVGSLPD